MLSEFDSDALVVFGGGGGCKSCKLLNFFLTNLWEPCVTLVWAGCDEASSWKCGHINNHVVKFGYEANKLVIFTVCVCVCVCHCVGLAFVLCLLCCLVRLIAWFAQELQKYCSNILHAYPWQCSHLSISNGSLSGWRHKLFWASFVQE